MQRALLFLALSGCFVDRVSPEGKECDAAHLCGAGFNCVPTVCPSEPTGQNLVINGDFEGAVSTWQTHSPVTGLEAQSRVVISGATARIYAKTNAGSTQRLEIGTVLADANPGAMLCAQAKLLSIGLERAIHVSLAPNLRDGGVDVPAPADLLADTSAYIPATAQKNVPHQVSTSLQPRADFIGATLVVLAAPPVAMTDEFFVDDVRAWAVPAKVCQAQ